VHSCKDLFGTPPRVVKVYGFDRPDRHSALLPPDAVLRDPGSLATSSDANTKAGQAVVEEDLLQLPW